MIVIVISIEKFGSKEILCVSNTGWKGKNSSLNLSMTGFFKVDSFILY